MRRAGIAFGSHTATHRQLRSLCKEQVESELRFSRRAIEDALGEPVTTFAYPYAFPEADRPFVCSLQNMLAGLGYTAAVTTAIGTAELNAFFLKRLPVNEWDDRALFRAKLEGGYDWLHLPQVMSKRLLGTGRNGR
jgi:peptidoglycan/xylan/chitin deacetylase (PgdA/CDA1 family)